MAGIEAIPVLAVTTSAAGGLLCGPDSGGAGQSVGGPGTVDAAAVVRGGHGGDGGVHVGLEREDGGLAGEAEGQRVDCAAEYFLCPKGGDCGADPKVIGGG